MAMAHYLFMAMVAATVCIHFTLSDTQTAETESLRTSLSGLRATLRILIITYEEELDSLLALPEHQNSSELVALHTVTKILIENSCDLMTLKLDNFNCTSTELKQLRLEVDAHMTIRLANEKILSYRDDISGIDDRDWIETHVKCEASEGTLEIFNKAFGENSFSLEGCDSRL